MSMFEVEARTPFGSWMSILRYAHSPQQQTTCTIYCAPPTSPSSATRPNSEHIATQYETVESTKLGEFVDIYC